MVWNWNTIAGQNGMRSSSLRPHTFHRFLTLSSSLSSKSPNKGGTEVGQANQAPKPPAGSTLPRGPLGVPTFLDKLFLVWSGQYKSTAEIPKIIDGEKIHRARSWSRIRINIAFLFLAAASGGVMVYLGKRDAARGQSVMLDNFDWHKKMNESSKKD